MITIESIQSACKTSTGRILCTVIKLAVWPTQADRTNGAEPVRCDSDLLQFPTDLQMQADNPIAYA